MVSTKMSSCTTAFNSNNKKKCYSYKLHFKILYNTFILKSNNVSQYYFILQYYTIVLPYL